MATVPMLVGASLQLVTPLAVPKLGSYRRWVVFCARAQAVSFLPLAVGAALESLSLAALGVATIAYWAFGMSTSSAWNAWVTSLVPERMRAVFFTRRTRAAQGALLVGLVDGGLALEFGRAQGAELRVFAVLFLLAAGCRLTSVQFLATQSEQPGLAAAHRLPGLATVSERLRRAGSLRLLVYLLAMQTTTHVAAPYFTPYMLKALEFSYTQFMTLTAAAFAARIAVLPLFGRIARRHGARQLLWLGGLGIVPLPLLWLVSSDFHYLLGVQLLAGCAWAAVELSTTLSFFKGIADRDRSSVLTVFNLANAAAVALGALAGAQLLAWLDDFPAAYGWLFVLFSGGRLLTLALLHRTRAARGMPGGLRLRTLAVRPSGGTIQRPILASADESTDAAQGPERAGDAPDRGSRLS